MADSRAAKPRPPLWICSACGRAFANIKQSHTCAPLGGVDDHFRSGAPEVRATFDAILVAASGFGPLRVLAEKSRIAFQVRMSFAAFTPRRRWLNGHLVLPRAVDSPRFLSVQTFSPRNVLHTFRLVHPDEVDEEFVGWLGEAYAVGAQQHLD